VLSEELPDPEARLARRRVWIVDPLDGTRDFVARTGQFSVHVALAVDGEAVVGAVYQPTTGVMFAASRGGGAWRAAGETRQPLRVSTVADPAALRVGVSRLNASARIWRCLAAAGLEHRAVAMGASVKHMAVADGALEAAINLGGGEQEWDTAAPEVVIREAGGMVTDAEGQPFRYNQRDLAHHRGSIASNGACHAALLELVRRTPS
jgi:3'(2'), 5'-bisphosphate nucleotidase